MNTERPWNPEIARAVARGIVADYTAEGPERAAYHHNIDHGAVDMEADFRELLGRMFPSRLYISPERLDEQADLVVERSRACAEHAEAVEHGAPNVVPAAMLAAQDPHAEALITSRAAATVAARDAASARGHFPLAFDRDAAARALRPAVLLFALTMETKLRENDGGQKPDWKDEETRFLLRRLGEESEELTVAIHRLLGAEHEAFKSEDGTDRTPGWQREVLREAADVGNLAMMIADNEGDLRGFDPSALGVAEPGSSPAGRPRHAPSAPSSAGTLTRRPRQPGPSPRGWPRSTTSWCSTAGRVTFPSTGATCARSPTGASWRSSAALRRRRTGPLRPRSTRSSDNRAGRLTRPLPRGQRRRRTTRRPPAHHGRGGRAVGGHHPRCPRKDP